MYHRNYLCWGSQQHVSLFSRISNDKLPIFPESFRRKPRRVTKTFHEQGNRSTVVFCITRAIQNWVNFFAFSSLIRDSRQGNKFAFKAVSAVLTPRDELDRFKDLWEPLYLHYVFFFFFFFFLGGGEFFSHCVSKLIILGSPKVFSGVTTVIISHLWWVILGALYSGFVWPGTKKHRKYHHYQRDTFDRCNARLRQGSEL